MRPVQTEDMAPLLAHTEIMKRFQLTGPMVRGLARLRLPRGSRERWPIGDGGWTRTNTLKALEARRLLRFCSNEDIELTKLGIEVLSTLRDEL